MRINYIAAIAALAFSGSALAFTCAAPVPIFSDSVNPGNTCEGTNSLPTYGGISSPQPEIVYSFTADSAAANLVIDLQGLPGGAVFLMPSPCASSTDPTHFGFDGTPLVINPGELVDGSDYFLIVTADPGGPADACGEYSLNVNGQLPVELQSFSID